MGLFGKDVGICVECGQDVPGGRAIGATACRCKDCREAWGNRADVAILATRMNSEARRKAEAEQDRTY